jgi:uncharacterized protein YggT (Ycf19 family)
LSWFVVDRNNLLIISLDDVVRPVLSPLQRLVPRLGIFDITPIIAVAILYIVPLLLTWLLL